MRILFFINTLTTVGGAEKVLAHLANHFSLQHDVVIATFDSGFPHPSYHVSSRIKTDSLGIQRISTLQKGNHFFAGIKKVRDSIKRNVPDIIISFMTYENVLMMVSARKMGIPIIVSERNDPRRTTKSRTLIFLRKKLYPKASAVVVQTTETLKLFGFPVKNGVVIPNAVLPPQQSTKELSISLPSGKKIIAVGGMTSEKIYQKGFDLLLQIFHDIRSRYPDWSLVILGEGPEKQVLEERIRSLNLENAVFLPGRVQNIYSVLKAGDLFVLPSRYEGFPNALCEAMSCGLPVVSFDCPTGPKDIIQDNIDGLLVELDNVERFTMAVETLLNDAQKRELLGKEAKKVTERFSVDRIHKLWEDLCWKSIESTRGKS